MQTSPIDRTLVSLMDPDSFTAEQYQGLRLKLEDMRQTRDLRVIAVSSPGEGDGKTVTAINLAAALGRGSAGRVLLIDADFRRPGIGGLLAADRTQPGFADAVADSTITLSHVTQTRPDINFAMLPTGSPPTAVHDILRSPRLTDLLHEARQHYDFVVVDTPPLVPVFDSALLARSVDGMLIVVAADKTPQKLLEESLNLLDPAKVVGIVFNGDRQSTSARYKGRYKKYFSRRSVEA
jgi:protein-tyrosine kinase